MVKRLLILGVVVLLGSQVGKGYLLVSGSMTPTILKRENILVDKLTYHFKDPVRGDVVLFQYPEDETKVWVKRIIGAPGDTIEIKDKVVSVNGTPLQDESFTQRVDPGIIDGRINPRDNHGPITVPPDSYFVMGDNRDQSLDSRFWGFVKREKIVGKAKMIYWSEGEAPRWDRIGNSIH